jgi:NADH dehydrogenase
MRILVVGGTGFIGQHVVAKLATRGESVFVPTRRLAHARELMVHPTVTIVPADVHDQAVVDGLVQGMDVVINLVGVLHSPRAKSGEAYGQAFARAHVELPASLARACAKHGVKRLMHVSALGASATGTSEYLRSKAAGEAAIAEVAGSTPGLCTTVFRPSVVFGPKDKFMNMFAGLAKWFFVLPLAGSQSRLQPIYVDDVARAILNAMDQSGTCGKTYDLAGPQVYTLGELVGLAAKYSGRRRAVLDLPMSVGRLQAWFFECLPGEPLMSRDNLDSLQTDNVSDQPIDPILDVIPTPLEAVAPTYLKSY